MLKLKRILPLLISLLVATCGAFAQMNVVEPVSDDELKSYAGLLPKVQNIEHQAQVDMVNAVDKKWLDMEKFHRIHQSQTAPGDKDYATEAELDLYRETLALWDDIQTDARMKIMKMVRKEGLTMDRYMEIMMAVHEDADLRNKLREYMERQ
ncbi:MAG: DUF4168 domain-containing protein [Bacteroidota bacterium]